MILVLLELNSIQNDLNRMRRDYYLSKQKSVDAETVKKKKTKELLSDLISTKKSLLNF